VTLRSSRGERRSHCHALAPVDARVATAHLAVSHALCSLTSVVVERMDLDRAVREVEARNRALAEDIMVKQEAAKGAAVHINIVRANDFAAARAELESLAARQAAVWDRVDPEKHLRELGDRRKALDEQVRGCRVSQGLWRARGGFAEGCD